MIVYNQQLVWNYTNGKYTILEINSPIRAVYDIDPTLLGWSAQSVVVNDLLLGTRLRHSLLTSALFLLAKLDHLTLYCRVEVESPGSHKLQQYARIHAFGKTVHHHTRRVYPTHCILGHIFWFQLI